MATAKPKGRAIRMADPQRARHQGQEAELGSGRSRGKPLGPGKHVLHGNRVVLHQMNRIGLHDELAGHKGDDARRTLHQRSDAGAGILVGCAQLLVGEVGGHILQAEELDGPVFAPHLLPVGDFFVEDVLDFPWRKFIHHIFLVQCQYVSLFDNLAPEQAQSLREEEEDDEHNRQTRHKAATCQYPCDNLFQYISHISISRLLFSACKERG